MSKSFLDSLNEVLKGNQHKIDANKNGRVDAHDFKLLRAKNKKDTKQVAEDLDEPDWEGQMAKTELKAICDKADKLDAMLKDEDQLEAWVQSKISNAKMHIDAIHDYMTYREKPNMEAKVPNIAAGPGSLTVFGSKSAFEEVDFFAEAKRGRPRKDGAKFAGEDDTQEADKNIMNQLRKKPEGEHQNLTFNNGEKKKVHVIHATRALSMLQNSKPSERLDIQNSLAHSHDRFMQTVKTGRAVKDEPRAKVSLAKRVSEEAEPVEENALVPAVLKVGSNFAKGFMKQPAAPKVKGYAYDAGKAAREVSDTKVRLGPTVATTAAGTTGAIYSDEISDTASDVNRVIKSATRGGAKSPYDTTQAKPDLLGMGVKNTVDTVTPYVKGAVDTAKKIKNVIVGEEAELEEAVSVKKRDYSWGKMITVHHGSSHSFPLHPEHQEKIAKLKDGESVSFKDETKAKVKAHREGDTIHLSHEGSSTKTPVAYSHFAEEYIDEAGAFTGGQIPSQQARDAVHAAGRGAWDSLTLGGGKYVRGTADYLAKKGLNLIGKGPEPDWNKEVEQEREKDIKAQTEHPTAWKVGDYGATAATSLTGIGGAARVAGWAGIKGAAKLANKIDASKTLSALDSIGNKGIATGLVGYGYGAYKNPKATQKDFETRFGVNESLNEDSDTKASDRRSKKAVTFRDPKTGKMKVKWQSMPKKEIHVESVVDESKIVPKPKIKTGEIGFMKGGGPEQHAAIAESFLIELTNEQIEKISEVFEKLNEKNKEAFINSASSSIEGSQAMLDFAINIE